MMDRVKNSINGPKNKMGRAEEIIIEKSELRNFC